MAVVPWIAGGLLVCTRMVADRFSVVRGRRVRAFAAGLSVAWFFLHPAITSLAGMTLAWPGYLATLLGFSVIHLSIGTGVGPAMDDGVSGSVGKLLGVLFLFYLVVGVLLGGVFGGHVPAEVLFLVPILFYTASGRSMERLSGAGSGSTSNRVIVVSAVLLGVGYGMSFPLRQPVASLLLGVVFGVLFRISGQEIVTNVNLRGQRDVLLGVAVYVGVLGVLLVT